MITIHFSTDNAAFDDDAEATVADILRHMADHVDVWGSPGEHPVTDPNGNWIGRVWVGRVTVTED